MTIAQLIPLAIQISMAFIVLGVALTASFNDFTYLLRRPGLLIRSLLSMYVIMPAFAIALAKLFDLNHVVEAALIALALSPVPPLLPKKEVKAGGAPSYVLGLLVVAAILAIVYVPLAAEGVGRAFGRDVEVSTSRVAFVVSTSIFAALVVGVCIKAWWPSLADKLAKPVSIIGTVVLVLAFVPVLVKMWPAIASLVGNFSIVAIVAFVLVGLLSGHLLGGPEHDDRTVLALSTATRHPAVAMTILFQAQQQATVLAALILVLLVAAIVSVPYVRWRRRRNDVREQPRVKPS
jgi:BASS family bile acid:Na+ symporter